MDDEKTRQHILRVQELLTHMAEVLMQRGRLHDVSKLQEPELSFFDNARDLSEVEYNSKEYWDEMSKLKTALNSHYSKNSHHPEHYSNGIDGMDLMDIVEMYFDWKASGERHNDGSMQKSIKEGKKRFNMSDQLARIFENTDRETKDW